MVKWYSSLKEIEVLPEPGIASPLNQTASLYYYTIPKLFLASFSFLKKAAKTSYYKKCSWDNCREQLGLPFVAVLGEKESEAAVMSEPKGEFHGCVIETAVGTSWLRKIRNPEEMGSVSLLFLHRRCH